MSDSLGTAPVCQCGRRRHSKHELCYSCREPRQQDKPLVAPEERTLEIVRLSTEEKRSARYIAEHMGVSTQHVYVVLRRAKLPLMRGQKP